MARRKNDLKSNGPSSGDKVSSSWTPGFSQSDPGGRTGAVSVSMFKALADQSHDFVGVFDLEFKPFYVNEAGRKLFGLGTIDEACVTRVREFFLREDQSFMMEEIFPKVLKEGTQEVEIRCRNPRTEAVLWIHWHIFQARDEENRVIGYMLMGRDTTEKKQNEEALKVKTERYRQLFESMQEAFFLAEVITDEGGQPVDYVFQEANPALESITGLNASAIIGRRVTQVLPGVDPHWIAIFGKVALTGKPARFEEYSTPLKRWFEAYAYATKPGQFAVMFVDITERKLTEAALRESEARLKATLCSAADEIWIADTEGRLISISDSVKENLGVSSQKWADVEAAIDQLEIFQADGTPRPRDKNILPRALRGEVMKGEGEMIRNLATGALRWREVSGAPVRDAGGKIIGAVAVARDITQRKQAEKDVHESEEKLRAVIEGAPLAMALTGPSGEILLRNPRFDLLWGRPPHTTTASTYSEVYEGYHLDGRRIKSDEWPGARSVLKGEVIEDEVYEIVQAGGRRITCWFGSVPIRNASGEILGAVVVFRDITEERRTQEALRRSETHFRELFESLIEAYCVIEMIFDDAGKPVDFRYLETNPAFERHATRPMLGKRIKEIVPDFEQFWLDQYGQVALTGTPAQLEYVVEGLGNQWFHVSAFRIGDAESRRLAVVFENITERKKAEDSLRKSQERESYLLRLGDTLRALKDPVEVQEQASLFLAEHLGAERALYFEVHGPEYVIERDYVRGVEHLRGRFPIADFGPSLVEAFKAGKTVVVEDVQREEGLSGEERMAYAKIEIGAHVGVPLVKGGQLVAGLAVHSRAPRKWRTEEIALIQETAERTWASVDRARTEKALAKSEKNYRTLFSSIDEGFCVIELLFDAQGKPNDWRFLEVNPAFERHNGLVNATGKTIRELAPGIETKWFDIYGRVVLTGLAVRVEESSEALNRWFDLYAFRVGEPREHRVAVLFTDITGRRRAEKALERAHERLQYHIQNTPLAVIEFDEHLRVSLWSGQAERIFGWTAAEVLGRHMFDIPWILEEDLATIKNVAEGMNSGRTLRGVSPNRNVRKDGKVIWCEWYNSSLNDTSGAMQSIQSLVLDVTERKEAEAVLARSKEDLEQLVAERTSRLQELVGELEHFSYTITHDMRAPLRGMQGFAEALSESLQSANAAEAEDFLRRIRTSANRMDLLITDALQYAKAVRQELPMQPVDAAYLLRGMLDSYPEFQPDRARIEVAGPIPAVIANPAGLTQVFSNLLGNAVKFRKPGTRAHVRVWAETFVARQETNARPADGSLQAEGEYVRIWVEDDGIGIPESMKPKVFDMFARGHSSYEGTGIGLALVRKVAQRMGGKVGLESELDKGSRFWVELRLARLPGECS